MSDITNAGLTIYLMLATEEEFLKVLWGSVYNADYDNEAKVDAVKIALNARMGLGYDT